MPDIFFISVARFLNALDVLMIPSFFTSCSLFKSSSLTFLFGVKNIILFTKYEKIIVMDQVNIIIGTNTYSSLFSIPFNDQSNASIATLIIVAIRAEI